MPGLVRGLEDCFWEIQRDAEQGKIPIPALDNLDHYYEIGAELDLENIELLDEHQYEKLYTDQLAIRHMHHPIPPDQRFWRRELSSAD